jgi:hypothetical protein
MSLGTKISRQRTLKFVMLCKWADSEHHGWKLQGPGSEETVKRENAQNKHWADGKHDGQLCKKQTQVNDSVSPTENSLSSYDIHSLGKTPAIICLQRNEVRRRVVEEADDIAYDSKDSDFDLQCSTMGLRICHRSQVWVSASMGTNINFCTCQLWTSPRTLKMVKKWLSYDQNNVLWLFYSRK